MLSLDNKSGDLLKTLGKSVTVPSLNAKKGEQAERKKKSAMTAGKNWFDLPETPLTDELKQDFRLIKMRGYLDPRRFYKKEKGHKFPKYFQVGRVVEGPTEFFSSRLTNKQRRSTMVEEVLSDGKVQTYLKRKFSEVQESAPKRKKALNQKFGKKKSKK